METGYFLAFTTGIFGGFGHCIGMCGPLVASYALAQASAPQPFLMRMAPHLLYNSGRITTYALIGGVMGLSGSFVNITGRLAGIQNIVAIFAGVAMIFMGLSIAGIGAKTAWIEKHNLPILRAAQTVLAWPSTLRYYPLGLILGLLPCGLSYTIFIASAGTGGLFPGLLTSLLFGLGTLPALLVFGAVITSISASLRGRIYKAGGVVVMIMGIYFLFRGIRIYANM
ncbi:MAG TPA: sulfite exporter TauE/SafE family protein [Nitrospirota bacterium]|nr:sulfite exporter TauE/SafE family protein [Nitrospirota bacterium]